MQKQILAEAHLQQQKVTGLKLSPNQSHRCGYVMPSLSLKRQQAVLLCANPVAKINKKYSGEMCPVPTNETLLIPEDLNSCWYKYFFSHKKN